MASTSLDGLGETLMRESHSYWLTMSARVEGKDHGWLLRERLEKLKDERMTLQNDLDMACAALSPSSDVPEPDPISNIVNTLKQLYATDAVKVITLTQETQATAAKMSFNIRKRDMERVRVQNLRKILFEIQGLDKNLLRLEEEAERGNLGEICRLFRSVSVAVEDSQVGEGWKIYYQCRTAKDKDLTGRTLDVKDIILKRLAGALHATEILASGDVDETMRRAFEMLQLYRWIGESSTGIRTVASLVQKYASRSLEAIVSGASTLDFRFAVKTGKVGDFVRGLTGWCRTEVERAGFELDVLQEVMASISEKILYEGQAALITLTKAFSQERNLYSTVSTLHNVSCNLGRGQLDSLGRTETARTIDIRELDMLVAELAIICQNCTSLSLDSNSLLSGNGPMLTMNTMMLFKTVSELLVAYCTLEQSYIALGIEKALTISQVMEEGSTSSCVEDVFFVIRKCCMRAVAIGEEECAIKVLSRSKGLLVSSFIPHLSKRARQLFPDAKSGDSVMIVANDAAAARMCLEGIVDELRELLDSDATLLYSLETMLDKNDVTLFSSKSRLSNVIVDMEALADRLDKLALTSLETIYATQVKSKLDPCLFQIIRDLSDPASEDTAALLRLIPLLDRSILLQLQLLSEDNLVVIVLMISRAIAMQLESFLASLQHCTKERLDGFEMDLRKLTSFLASLTELQAKETFSRLIRTLADLGEKGDLGNSRNSLNEAQVNSILQSRDIL